MPRLLVSIRKEITSMKKWNWLQWILFSFIVIIIAMVIGANWCFPKGEAYQTREFGWSEYSGSGYFWDTEPSPESNPAWVRFIQDNSESIWVVLPICLGLGILIYRETSKREKKLFNERAVVILNTEFDLFMQIEHPVKWYREGRKKGISTDDLLEICSRIYDGKIPAAIRREIRKEKDI